MSFWSKLLGGGAKTPEPSSESYSGFTITPTPQKDGSQFRICARIEKEVNGELRSHTLIRADTLGDIESANLASIGKAKQMIDEQGEALFGKSPGTHA